MKAGALLLGLGGLLVWEGLVRWSGMPEWLLPSPSAVVLTLWEVRSLLLGHALATLGEALAGLAAAMVCGILLAVLLHFSPLAERTLYPWLVASQMLPIVAIAPLLTLWFGFGLGPKVAVIALISFFPIAVSGVDGLRSADPDYIRLLRTMGAGRRRTFFLVEVPAALPSFFSGLRLAAAYSMIGAVLGEWVGASRGLGYMILRASSQFLTERVFAAIVLLTFMGFFLFLAVGWCERRLTPWRHHRK